jgi:hypothetical protein
MLSAASTCHSNYCCSLRSRCSHTSSVHIYTAALLTAALTAWRHVRITSACSISQSKVGAAQLDVGQQLIAQSQYTKILMAPQYILDMLKELLDPLAPGLFHCQSLLHRSVSRELAFSHNTTHPQNGITHSHTQVVQSALRSTHPRWKNSISYASLVNHVIKQALCP